MSLASILILLLFFFAAAATLLLVKRRPPTSQERERIARLRDQGKLSAEEAADLLSAMGAAAVAPGPLPPDKHLRVAACALIFIGVLAGGVGLGVGLPIVQKAREISVDINSPTLPPGPVIVPPGGDASQGLRRVRVGGWIAPPGGDAPSGHMSMGDRMMSRFQTVALTVVAVSALIAICGVGSGILLLTSGHGRLKYLARSFGVGTFFAALVFFPLGTLAGAYGIWVLTLREDAGRYF